MFIENINGPEDVKKLNEDELVILADEVRKVLIGKLSNTGGHVGSNLGVIELAVAIHYVFDSPIDKIIWDVSHQSYPHKILTGRKDAYIYPDKYKNVTGFTNPNESEHDHFTIGHTATSVSLALGMAKARDVLNKNENVVAIIGDGALGGGEAYEALNYAGEYGKNLIVIVNDNEMSVAENHGGLYRKLKELRDSEGQCPDNIFKGLNLEYIYYENGNDVKGLIKVLKSVKDSDKPVVVHIHTKKGKGLVFAEQDMENWHAGVPFNLEDGSPKNQAVYDTTLHDSLVKLLNENEKAVVITAGTPRALWFVGEEKEKWTKAGRFVDVGIAEEHAMAMASGIAKAGGAAVFGVYAPFLQRAYDQLSHDLCLNNNPATILVLTSGVYGMKSNTHLGLCDIQMLTHVPNLVYLNPAFREEYLRMLEYATTQREHPIAIRVPNRFISCNEKDDTDYSIINKAKVLKQGQDVAIIATGALIPLALSVYDDVKEKYGKEVTVINPIFLTGVDEELLGNLLKNHGKVITIEDGELDGGYGERIASYYGNKDMKVINLGISKKFHSDFNADELLAENGISKENLINLMGF